MTRVPLLLAVLCCAPAGCAPEPQAPGAASAPLHHASWQQFCEQAISVPHASALVSARGAEGWELVAMYNGVLCYKRPTPDYARMPFFSPSVLGAPPAPAPPSPVPIMRDPGF